MISIQENQLLSREAGISLELLLREELQKLALRYLSERRFFTAGVFQGGTALRLCFQGPRFSEDLDFVFRERDHQIFQTMENLLQQLTRFIEQHAPETRNLSLTQQKASPGLHRFRLRVAWTTLTTRMSINLEFANQPSYQPTTRILRVDPIDVPLVVESEQEILADKIVALSLRNFIKGRDLWDIDFLTRQHHVPIPPPDLLVPKAAGYGASSERLVAGLVRRLEQLPDQGPAVLRTEMERFLPPHLLAALTGAGDTDTLAAVARVVAVVLETLGQPP